MKKFVAGHDDVAPNSAVQLISGNQTGALRSSEIDILRAFGILLMIAGHIGFGSLFDRWIHGFHMPLFFLISGFFYKEKQGRSLRKDVFHLVKSVLLPYFYFFIFNYLIWLYFYWDKINFLKPIKALLGVNNYCQYDTFLPYAEAMWFLTALFFSRLIYLLVDYTVKNKVLRVAVIVLISLFGCLSDYIMPWELLWSLGPACAGVGFYAIGRWASLVKKKKGDGVWRLPIWLTLVLGCAVSISILKFPTVSVRKSEYGYLLPAYINACVATLVGYNVSVWVKKWGDKFALFSKFTAFLEFVGKNTPVYLCFNQVVIKSVEVLWKTEMNQGNIALWKYLLIKAAILFVSVVILSVVAYLFSKTKLRVFIGRGNSIGWPVGAISALAVVMAGIFVARHVREAELQPVVVSKPLTMEELGIAGENVNGNKSNEVESILSANLAYITNVHWKESNPYSMFASTTTTTGETADINQKRERDKSRESFQKATEEILKQNLSLTTEMKISAGDYLRIAGSIGNDHAENAVRPWAHDCYTMANALYFDVCSEDCRQEVLAKTVLLVASLARNHCSNMARGWGNEWQSALWAENIGYAAWLLWEDLPEETQRYVTNMVTYEANRLLSVSVPYYADANGRVLYPGDTKGEENAWNAKILALAVCMFPTQKNASLWEEKMEEYLLSATAQQEDLILGESIDGYSLQEILNGYNVLDNGVVVNHSRYHIDYISCIMEEMTETAILYKLAGRSIKEAAFFHLEDLYRALIEVDLGQYDSAKAGHHFYENENGTAQTEINMPGENDWSQVGWYASYFLNDTIAEVFHMDRCLPDGLKADDYAKLHLEQLMIMLAKNRDGRFYADGENSFVSGEAYAMHNMSKAYAIQRLFEK